MAPPRPFTPHILTDPDKDAYERRASAIASAVPIGPDALLRSVQREIPAYHGLSLDAIRARFSLDDARQVLAGEHGEADWQTLLQRLEALTSEPQDEPFREAALATRAGQPQQVRERILQNPEILAQRGTHGHTLLDLACRAATSHLAIPSRPGPASAHEIVALLLEAGADVRAAADHGWTPLHTAAFAGHAALARTLLAAGASVHAEVWETSGATPLAYALFYAHDEAAEVLARSAAVPDNLRTAAALGKLDRLAEFFAADGSLLPGAGEGRDFYRPMFLFPRWTPSDEPQEWLDEALCWAARSGRVEAMEQLVAHGADVNAHPYRGTPLVWAVYSDRVDAARWLLDQSADPSLIHDFGGTLHGVGATALHLAAQYGNLRCLRLLLERGGDPTLVDALHGGTPRDWAEFGGQREAVELLRDR